MTRKWISKHGTGESIEYTEVILGVFNMKSSYSPTIIPSSYTSWREIEEWAAKCGYVEELPVQLERILPSPIEFFYRSDLRKLEETGTFIANAAQPTHVSNECTHFFIDYTGLNERYKYCTKCDKKS